MTAAKPTNPFQVLGLPTDATAQDVMGRAQELLELEDDRERARTIQQAVDELTLRPSPARRLHELHEVPDTEYRDAVWHEFERAHRRNPVDPEALGAMEGRLRLEDFDLPAVLRLLTDGLLTVPDVSLRPAVEHTPTPPGAGATPVEVRDVLFG